MSVRRDKSVPKSVPVTLPPLASTMDESVGAGRSGLRVLTPMTGGKDGRGILLYVFLQAAEQLIVCRPFPFRNSGFLSSSKVRGYKVTMQQLGNGTGRNWGRAKERSRDREVRGRPEPRR